MKRKWTNKKLTVDKFCVVIGIVMMLLVGCGKEKTIQSKVQMDGEIDKQDYSSQNSLKNVEQRGYATVLVISDGQNEKKYHFDLGIAQEKHTGEKSEKENLCSFDCDSFGELSEKYSSVKGKDLSLTHLKVILLSETGEDELFWKETTKEDYFTTELSELLQEMDKNVEIAKTCPVLQLEDKEEFLAYLENAKEPVGTYISNLVKEGERQEKNIPWLKDYLKAFREGKRIRIYKLEPVSEGFTLIKLFENSKR